MRSTCGRTSTLCGPWTLHTTAGGWLPEVGLLLMNELWGSFSTVLHLHIMQTVDFVHDCLRVVTGGECAQITLNIGCSNRSRAKEKQYTEQNTIHFCRHGHAPPRQWLGRGDRREFQLATMPVQAPGSCAAQHCVRMRQARKPTALPRRPREAAAHL